MSCAYDLPLLSSAVFFAATALHAPRHMTVPASSSSHPFDLARNLAEQNAIIARARVRCQVSAPGAGPA